MADIRGAAVRFEKVQKSYDGENLVVKDLNLDIAPGEFLTMLGPSGSGKTTCLMMLAGFEPATHGEIFLNNHPINNVPPYKRGIGMVFQNYALFPHMTVAENLAFPLEVRKMSRAERDAKVKRALDMVQMGAFGGRRPAQLSGGQQQRIALARALVFDPALVLMDEPLGALDKQLREHMQYEIKHLHESLGITVVYVTHDQSEALTMSDRVAVFNDGVIQQLADPHTIYTKPLNKYVADFIGSPSINFLDGEIEAGSTPVFKTGEIAIPLANYEFSGDKAATGPASFGIRPEHVVVGDQAEGMPYTSEVLIEVVEPMGSDTLAWATLAGQDFRFRVDGQSPLREGDTERIGFDPARASIFDAETELRM